MKSVTGAIFILAASVLSHHGSPAFDNTGWLLTFVGIGYVIADWVGWIVARVTKKAVGQTGG